MSVNDMRSLRLPDAIVLPLGAAGLALSAVLDWGASWHAISAALGDDIFRRAPVTADMILTSLEAGKPTVEPLTAQI